LISFGIKKAEQSPNRNSGYQGVSELETVGSFPVSRARLQIQARPQARAIIQFVLTERLVKQ